eukprot:TRINITY_DN78223_c0_g1_i1.p1 TRINITY_DN78223_c0_g1~~TRINITY_DN78223_c0_g1_i1.p1  ORF type:complete len:431 (+),score=92.21 TRINITY_DN78223_c0_g1_i1:189-1481(+)
MSSGSGYGNSETGSAFPQQFSLPMQGDSEDWPQDRIYGDFYREPVEQVTRGITLQDHPTLFAPTADAFKCSPGDYYREDEDVFKGVSMPSPFQEEELFFKDPAPQCSTGKGLAVQCSGELQRFGPCHRPPATPMDSFWQFEVTTLHLKAQEPSSIGNMLLDFFTSKMIASIIKVNCHKFSIKADVFVDGMMCTLKCRTYADQGDAYAVEFQRRSGDCITFNYAYQQAVIFLKSEFAVASDTPADQFEGAWLPSPALCRTATPSGSERDEDISPLLDMAGLAEFPGLQAESATALAEVAKDSSAASTLCTESAFKEIRKLLQSDSTDVAYPTARLLSALGHCPQAPQLFVGEGLLPLIIQKVRLKAGGRLVQQEFAQALCSAVRLCAGLMGERERDMAQRHIADAIKETGSNEDISHLLEEALLTLRLQLE